MKQLKKIEAGGRFLYGGIEWVKLDQIGNGALALAAEPVFKRAFDDKQANDWCVSSLRRELNGVFLESLVREGADRLAFLDWKSDLTADDGMDNYGSAIDKIALLSDALYRSCRRNIPPVKEWCWTLTPRTCIPGDVDYTRSIEPGTGALSCGGTYAITGVRPLCFLLSEINVGISGGETAEQTEKSRAEIIQGAAEAVMETLGEYGAAYWVEVLTRVMYGVFAARENAEEIAQEEAAKQSLNLAPGAAVDLTGNKEAAAG